MKQRFPYFSLHYVIAVAAEALVELLESVTSAFSCSSGFPLPLPSLGHLTLTLNLFRPPGWNTGTAWPLNLETWLSELMWKG